MNYIKRTDKTIEIDSISIKDTINNYIEKLCNKNFKSIDSIKKTCRRLGIKRSMPLFINNEILLVPISISSNVDSLYVNYYEIEDYIIRDDNTTLFFKNKTSLNIIISRYRMNELFNRVNILLNYLISYN